MKVRVLSVGAILATPFALAACGSSGTAGATAPGTTPPSSPTTSAEPSIPPRDLKPQLVTVGDLPTGWAVDNSSSSGASTPQCLKDFKATVHTPGVVKADFVQGTDVPKFDQQIAYYGTSAATAAKYDAAASILNNCKDVSFSTGATRVTGSIGAMSFPKVGDRSEAWQVILSAQGVTAGDVCVLVRKGAELEILVYGDIGTPDIDTATSIVRTAVAKMPAS